MIAIEKAVYSQFKSQWRAAYRISLGQTMARCIQSTTFADSRQEAQKAGGLFLAVW